MIKIDNDRCLRCGMCAATEPDVFEFNDDGDIEVKEENITEENKEIVEQAINSCPVGAIEEEKENDAE